MLKKLKEALKLSLWTVKGIFRAYFKSSQTPLSFIIGVNSYEDEIWLRKMVIAVVDLKQRRDDEFEKNKLERRKRLINLNREGRNGDDLVVLKYAQIVKDNFKHPIGVEFGSAYGGGVQDIAELWKGRGKYYGFDTFEGHPKELGEVGTFEANCMDNWYTNPLFGKDRLTYEFQRRILDNAGLDNAILVKELVTEETAKDLKEIHLAFLDMDMDKSMRDGFNAVKDKIVKGGYLLLHDAMPEWHLPKVHKLYLEIAQMEDWELISNDEGTYIVVFEKIC